LVSGNWSAVCVKCTNSVRRDSAARWLAIAQYTDSAVKTENERRGQGHILFLLPWCKKERKRGEWKCHP